MNDFLAQLRERLPFTLAVAATTLWVVAAGAYVQVHGSFVGLEALAPFELAVLVAAVTGPMAALWLFMAVSGQRRALGQFAQRMTELAAQNRQSLQQAESHARTLMQLQAQGARSQAMETRRLALSDMASNTAVLAERLGVVKRDAAGAAWARYGAGDVNVFVQSFLSFAVTHTDMSERMAEAVARDAVARVALSTIVRRFERLVATADEDKLATDIFEDGALGRAYRLFKSADMQVAGLSAAYAPHGATGPRPSESAPGSGRVANGEHELAGHRLAELSERREGASPLT